MLPQNTDNISYIPIPMLQNPAERKLQKTSSRSFRKHDAISALFCLLLGFLFIRYVLCRTDGFYTSIFYLLLFFSETFYLRKSGYHIKAGQAIQGALICVFALSFSFTASVHLHGLSFLFLTAALAWWIFAVGHGCSHVTQYFGFHLPAAMITYPIEELGAAVPAMATGIKDPKRATALKAMLIGLAASLPLTIVVAALLCEADAGIAHLLSDATTFLSEYIGSCLLQIAFGIPVGIWLFGSLYAASHPQEHPLQSDDVCIRNIKALELFPRMGLYAAVTPICILYLLYLGSQANYVLSAFIGKLPQTMTYSEYARRGFFELCFIAVINLAVILVLTVCSKKEAGKRHAALKGYSVFLCLCTLFILAAAFAKMFMYISAYGLTQLRLYTTWFMVLLAVIFILIFLRQFIQFPTARIIVTTGTILLTALCLVRPDALIAEYNLTRWEQGTLESLDVDMLCALSDDAYVVMLQHQDQLDTWHWESIETAIKNRIVHMQYNPEDSGNFSSQRLLSLYEEQCHEKE